MPTATTFKRIEDLTEYWLNALDDAADDLGFEFVGGYDDPLTTGYPAVHVSPGSTAKEVHATHMYLMQWQVEFWVTHAEATESHRKRTLTELQLVTTLVNFLERDKTLNGQIIFGYVLSERGGAIRPRSKPGSFLVSSQLVYQATAEVPF